MKNFLISTLLTVTTSLANAGVEVALVKRVDSEHCTLVQENTCKTQKVSDEKADAKCEKWHKKAAKKVGANRVVITDENYDEHRRPHYDGSTKTVKNREYIAAYYNCTLTATENSPIDEAEPESLSAPLVQPKSLEERLMTLQKLKNKGLITDAEYNAKRQEILDEI